MPIFPIDLLNLWPAAAGPFGDRAEESEYPLSWGALESEPRLSLAVLPTVSKYLTGTRPRVPCSGLQASYQSWSFSRATTCRKSPCEKER